MSNYRVSETLSDEQLLEIGNLFLISSISSMYNYTFDKIVRSKYDRQDGTDAEESMSIHFNAVVKDEAMKNHGWKDESVMIKVIVYDRYHDYTYFSGHRKTQEDKTWRIFWLSNHIEVIKYLETNSLING